LAVSGCTSSEELECGNNQLTSLDVSGCPSLEDLHCGNNQLASLDVSGCTSLEYLRCENNPITQEISGVFAYVLREHDKRYVYYKVEENGMFVKKWRYQYPDGHGWYYPGEPQRGYH
jgi:hypothetical protein